MSAAELNSSRERRLRRTVAELGECSIDDIEAIWGALSTVERAQLRPLLADAARVTPGNLEAFRNSTSALPKDGMTGNDDHSGVEEPLARLGELLPGELMRRLLFCVDDPQRERIEEALPVERRALLTPGSRVYAITPRASMALREAALEGASRLGKSPQTSPDAGYNAAAARPITVVQKLRRWIRRSA